MKRRNGTPNRSRATILLVVLLIAGCGGGEADVPTAESADGVVPTAALDDGREFFPNMRSLSDQQLRDLVSTLCEDMDDGGSATGALERQFAALQAGGLSEQEAIAFMGWQSAMATSYVCPEYESRLMDAVAS